MLPIVATVAAAYESDQLTHRDEQLLDSTEIADAIMAVLLEEAVARTNEATRCAASESETHAVLAEQIHAATSSSQLVWERGLTRAPGFSRFSAALERSAADRFPFREREDVFGDLTLWHSVILTLAGPCSTFEVAGVRIGSDKFDHFLDEGFNYFERRHEHDDLRLAITRGTATERSLFGLLTSKAFSWADLLANYEGYLFYEGLLGEQGTFTLQDGCVVQHTAFTWRDWIDSGYDEVLNPPTFTRLVERGVLKHLERNRDAVCAERARWDRDGFLQESLAGREPEPPWVAGPAPARTDPFKLDALCRGEALAPEAIRPRHAIREARRLGAR